MTILLRTILLTTSAVFLMNQAQADSPKIPADTGSFLSYCEGHLEDCRIAVVNANNYQMIRQLVNHEHACALPSYDLNKTTPTERIAIKREQTVTILNWLKANNAARRPKTEDAIRQAMAALWPKECK